MHNIIIQEIEKVIVDHPDVMKIALRQKAKFEGWLKFELAAQLEKFGMKEIMVEGKARYYHDRTDITFTHDDYPYSLELKTSNTNWKSAGINNAARPITKNIQSIVKDAEKLNSQYGIVAFVLFPIPMGDVRWEAYIERIVKKTGIEICKKANCKLVKMNIDDCNHCELLICTFMSRTFRNW